MTKRESTTRNRVGKRIMAVSAGRRMAELEERISELEDELQEARRLNVRVAELLDIVEELVVPIAQRDEAKLQAYLDSHADTIRR